MNEKLVKFTKLVGKKGTIKTQDEESIDLDGITATLVKMSVLNNIYIIRCDISIWKPNYVNPDGELIFFNSTDKLFRYFKIVSKS